MTGTIRRWHRFVADWVADSPWLRRRAGSGAAWVHYERHARARTAAQDRHARARTAHVLPRWQAAIGRLFGAGEPREGQRK